MNDFVKYFSWRKVVKNLYIYGILAVFVAVFTILSPKFLSVPGLINIVRASAPLIIVSAALSLLMISGHIDLSVGSLLGFSGVIFALLAQAGVPVFLATILTIVISAMVGAVNGLLVVKLKITPIISTLAMMNILLGVAKLFCGDSIPYVKKGLPSDFITLGRGSIGSIPIQLFFIAGVVGVFILLQKRSIFGKYSIAIGSNKMAATLSGVNTNFIVLMLFVMVGAVTGLAGVFTASKLTIADATAGIGFEVDVLIAILLGGISFSGGEGSVSGAVAGALILSILVIGMNHIGVPSFYQYLVKSAVLVLAITLDKFVKEKVADEPAC